MPSVEPLTDVPLAFPSVLQLATDAGKGSAPSRSWIQVARTGSFVSNRYGRFEITKQDLSTMLSNFTEITPKAPTELPVDFDHLSMDPKKPGDGIAAGWMKKLELRENGEELWAEVEWTPDGASRIANQEYRFVSPSFVKNHTHKDGKKIGTTLLAAAITNHPFLEGMKALTLYNFSAMGDLAVAEKQEATIMSTEHLDSEQATKKIIELANTLASEQGMSLRDATIAAARQLVKETEAYQEHFRTGPPQRAMPFPSPINLHRSPNEGFVELVTRVSRERRIDLKNANRVVSEAFPDMADAYARGETL